MQRSKVVAEERADLPAIRFFEEKLKEFRIEPRAANICYTFLKAVRIHSLRHANTKPFI
jgi:hypothetical protein